MGHLGCRADDPRLRRLPPLPPGRVAACKGVKCRQPFSKTMNPFNHLSRREVLLGAAVAATVPFVTASPAAAQELLKTPGAETPRPDPWRGLKAGVATYSLRGLKVEDAIAGIQRVDLK